MLEDLLILEDFLAIPIAILFIYMTRITPMFRKRDITDLYNLRQFTFLAISQQLILNIS